MIHPRSHNKQCQGQNLNQCSDLQFRVLLVTSAPNQNSHIPSTQPPSPQGKSTLLEFSDAYKITAEFILISPDY